MSKDKEREEQKEREKERERRTDRDDNDPRRRVGLDPDKKSWKDRDDKK